jgi:hypothetical protein
MERFESRSAGTAPGRHLPQALGRSFAALLVLGLTVTGEAARAADMPAVGESSAVAASSQQDPPADVPSANEPEVFSPEVVIHGYLTQAYAFSDGHQIIGIPKQGTADYRTAALQVRAALSPQDSFVLQLSHERNGLSPINAVRDELEIDWVFYAHRFGNATVKVGRMPIPFGIYNEVRDVGTLLPFYRPARPVYEETSFSTETIDGLLVSQGFDLGTSWHLDGTVHFGNWETFNGQLQSVRSEKSLGVELWLDTPLDGLRVGVGGFQCDQAVALPTSTLRLKRQVSHLSFEGKFGRIDAQVEFKRDTAQLATGGRNSRVLAGYGHLGFHVTDRLALHGEYDFLRVELLNALDLGNDRDRAAGLTYAFRPDLVLKGEYHWVKGFRVEDAPGLIPFRPVPTYKTQFGIVSLSVSF